MKKSVIFVPFVSFLITACYQSNGPCEYNITEIQAKIISFDPYFSQLDTTPLYHISLRFNESNLAKKNQYLEDWIPRIKGKTNAHFIKLNNLKTGDVYSGTVSEIKSGNCEPVYVSFNYYFKTD